MLMPSIFNDRLFEDWMDFPFRSVFSDRQNPIVKNYTAGMMKTDIKDKDGFYELDMELPGFKKEDVNAQLRDGYLTITANQNVSNEEKDEKGNYIRQERYTGQCSRSFFVGKDLKEEDIKAKFENGMLYLKFPKEDAREKVEENKFIAIEG